jgi:hypothetical protein
MLSSPALVLLCFSDTIRSHLTAQMDILPCTGMGGLPVLQFLLHPDLIQPHGGLQTST